MDLRAARGPGNPHRPRADQDPLPGPEQRLRRQVHHQARGEQAGNHLVQRPVQGRPAVKPRVLRPDQEQVGTILA